MRKVIIGTVVILTAFSLNALANPVHSNTNHASTVISVHHSGLAKLDVCR